MSSTDVKQHFNRIFSRTHNNSIPFLLMAITMALVWLLLNYYCAVYTEMNKAVSLKPQESASVEQITHTLTELEFPGSQRLFVLHSFFFTSADKALSRNSQHVLHN